MALSSDIDRVRLLISDVGGHNGNTFLFSDEEIDTFLALRPDVRQAASLALRTIAANEVQVSKRIKILDLQTDGPAVAKELRELADSLDAMVDGDDADFDVAELGVTPFARRELRGL